MCGLLKGMIEKIFKSGLTLNCVVWQGLTPVPVTCRGKLFPLIKSGIYNTRPNHKSQYLIHMNTKRDEVLALTNNLVRSSCKISNAIIYY